MIGGMWLWNENNCVGGVWMGERWVEVVVFFFFFQAEDGIRDRDGWLEFRRVLFRSGVTLATINLEVPWAAIACPFLLLINYGPQSLYYTTIYNITKKTLHKLVTHGLDKLDVWMQYIESEFWNNVILTNHCQSTVMKHLWHLNENYDLPSCFGHSSTFTTNRQTKRQLIFNPSYISNHERVPLTISAFIAEKVRYYAINKQIGRASCRERV